ncbi:MAG: DUF4867 family protein [Hespellia sp.]|nr:DUF4867 family protein [Hespellia sp.]
MEIQNVADAGFRKYGKVLKGYDCTRLIKEMEHTPLPEDVIYVPSVEELEALEIAEEFKNRAYGGLPIQIGYCNGNNHALNALEYHRSSEINVAVTDLILLIGAQQDISEDFQYDTAKVEAFKVPAGTAIEVYATTLHYAPCNAVEKGFQCVVVLPKDTNTDLTFELKGEDDDPLLTAKNKWLLAHPDAKIDGAVNGLVGENVTL